jgi:hypothetical protein
MDTVAVAGADGEVVAGTCAGADDDAVVDGDV